MSAADDAAPVSAAEAKTLFGPLARASAVILAVSGGPDSTALMLLAARWRRARRKGPRLLAVTVDHGMRPQSAAEVRQVKRLAGRLGVAHRTFRWRGAKPATSLQEAAREMRYRLLGRAARAAKADCILTAHTLDDQAETVLIRMTRGSGLTGLGAMARVSQLPVEEFERPGIPGKTRSFGGSDTERPILLVRPLLGIPKARLVATLERAKIGFADDLSNRDLRFARARLRDLMPGLAREGLDARRLALLVERIRRAEAAIEMTVAVAVTALSEEPWSERGPIRFPAERFARLPAEVALRLLGRAIAQVGEGRLQLGKLEALYEALGSSWAGRRSETFRLRRTLAGAVVTLTAARLLVERAPPRARSRLRSS